MILDAPSATGTAPNTEQPAPGGNGGDAAPAKATFTRTNNDANQAKWFRIFITWLISGHSLANTAATCGVSTRTLQRHFTPFWLIQPPRNVDKQRIYDQVFIDGTYFNTKCLVVVADISHVINWFWCTRESSWSYMRLLDPLAPPQLVTCDGDSGGLKAIKRLWPHTPVQRCIVHVKRNIQRATGLHPTSPMGKALRRLSFELLAVDNLDDAARWVVKLQRFGDVFATQLKARTYVKDVPFDQIPKSKRKNKLWWYTHEVHRGVYRQLVTMSQQGHLFAYLSEAAPGQRLERTTNSLEGGINAQIKKLMYDHRGLRDEQQRIACDWWLYMHTQLPDDPIEIARQQNWGQDALAKVKVLTNQETQATSGHEDGRPAAFDSAIDTAYNHSMGIRKGHIR
nr:IS1249 family transposase [Corynebacterium vitaeruminis]